MIPPPPSSNTVLSLSGSIPTPKRLILQIYLLHQHGVINLMLHKAGQIVIDIFFELINP